MPTTSRGCDPTRTYPNSNTARPRAAWCVDPALRLSAFDCPFTAAHVHSAVPVLESRDHPGASTLTGSASDISHLQDMLPRSRFRGGLCDVRGPCDRGWLGSWVGSDTFRMFPRRPSKVFAAKCYATIRHLAELLPPRRVVPRPPVRHETRRATDLLSPETPVSSQNNTKKRGGMSQWAQRPKPPTTLCSTLNV